MTTWLRRLLMIILPLFLCSCATIRLANEGNIKSPIEMPTYRINLTDEDWKSWGVSKKIENETLIFEKLKVWPIKGEVQGTITIAVMKAFVAPEGRNLTEKELADNIRNIEEKVMLCEGTYELQEVKKDDAVYNSKKLYSMTWKATKGSAIAASFKRSFFVKGAFYLYFPAAFKDNHTFYRFVITESYIPGSLIPFNLEQVYRVIDGFEIK